MKIWYGHGTEHSMNLVMIGTFKEERDAEKTMEVIELLKKHVSEEYEQYTSSFSTEFSDKIMGILEKHRLYILRPDELQQFGDDINAHRSGNQIEVRTNESDVSAFFKLLLERGAHLDVTAGSTLSSDDGEAK